MCLTGGHGVCVDVTVAADGGLPPPPDLWGGTWGWLLSLSEGPSSLEKLREALASHGRELPGAPAAFLPIRDHLRPLEAESLPTQPAQWLRRPTISSLHLYTALPGILHR